jgi:hypothetical protein
MPSSTLIRVQKPSLVNKNNYSNNNNERHTISMLSLFFHMFDYIYLFNTKLFFNFLLLVQRLLRFLIDLWIFAFVTLRGSRKKV